PRVSGESVETGGSEKRSQHQPEQSKSADDAKAKENRSARARRVAPLWAEEVGNRHRRHREHARGQQRDEPGADGKPQKRRAHVRLAILIATSSLSVRGGRQTLSLQTS